MLDFPCLAGVDNGLGIDKWVELWSTLTFYHGYHKEKTTARTGCIKFGCDVILTMDSKESLTSLSD